MKIAVGSDHRGVDEKSRIVQHLEASGHTAFDVGAHDCTSVDYPDVASEVSRKVASGEVDRGILICGTGIGMAISANKVPGVRAATCYEEITVELSRQHNDVNVLCLSADLTGAKRIERLIDIWISTEFEGGRHARRLDKVRALESEFGESNEPNSSC